MKRKDILNESQRLRMLEFAGVNTVANSNFISVDIQPAYEQAFTFNIYDFTKFLNENYESMRSLTFLFNGPDLGFPDENEYRYWLYEKGLEEEVLDFANFFDKGYAFFRTCMDEGAEEEEIVNLIKFMLQHNINDSRDLEDREMWDEFMKEYGYDEADVRDILEYTGNVLHIPELMEYLENYNDNIVLTGGGINECLKEVEIALKALNKPYKVYPRYMY